MSPIANSHFQGLTRWVSHTVPQLRHNKDFAGLITTVAIAIIYTAYVAITEKEKRSKIGGTLILTTLIVMRIYFKIKHFCPDDPPLRYHHEHYHHR